MANRKCKSGFLQAYLKLTEEQESPELFHLWSAISIISATLGRKCKVKRGHFDCFPNQYIILVSGSARCRKTSAARFAMKLYEKADIGNAESGKITTAMLYRDLNDRQKETGTSSMFIYSPELGSLLGPDSYISGLMMALTDFYDCPGTTGNRTKNQGVDVLKNVFINILGCTTPGWLSQMPPDMVEGGFSSRVLFVVQNKPRRPNPFPSYTEEMKGIESNLVHDLQQIAKMKGDFQLTEKAVIYYENWYRREYERVDDGDVRLRAYLARKGEHVLKVGMCISAARSDDREIDHIDITASLKLLEQLEANMPTAFRGVSFSESTKHIDRIMGQLQDAGGAMDHSTLLKRNSYYMDRDEMRKVIDTLLESNMIRMDTAKGKRRYHVIEEEF